MNNQYKKLKEAMISEFKIKIKNLDWMSKKKKKKAVEKLKKIT